jgi:hypothetical protein
LVFPVPYLCAHGATGEQVPPEPSSTCEPCTGCAAIRFLGAILQLLVHATDVFFLVTARGTTRRLLPGDRSWDCTMNTFLHWLWSTTSSNALCLMRMEPLMPSA